MSRAQGIAEEKLNALADFEESPLYSEIERDCIRYAHAMTGLPMQVTDELFERLRASFSEAEIVELTTMIAWENFRARFDHALDMESQEFTPEDVARLTVRSG